MEFVRLFISFRYRRNIVSARLKIRVIKAGKSEMLRSLILFALKSFKTSQSVQHMVIMVFCKIMAPIGAVW